MTNLIDSETGYLCTVYTLNKGGLDVAYTEAASLLGKLLKQGMRVFCPIAHCHTAYHLGDTPKEFDWWMEFDEGWIDKCDYLIVAMMSDWRKSKGISHEIAYAESISLPIYYLNPETMEMTHVPS